MLWVQHQLTMQQEAIRQQQLLIEQASSQVAADPAAAAQARAQQTEQRRKLRAYQAATPAAAAQARAQQTEQRRKLRADQAATPAAAAQARARRNEQDRRRRAQAAAAVDPDALAAASDAARKQQVQAERQSNEQEAFDLIVRPKHQPVRVGSVEDSVVRELQVAKDFQTYMDNNIPTQVCAVCAIYHGKALVKGVSDLAALHLELLRADGPKSSKMPRAGLTVVEIGGVNYCLCPDAVTRGPAGVVTELQLCNDCESSLRKGTVPRTSLVYWDTGPVPKCVDGTDFPRLSIIEELIVSVWRVSRYTVLARPPGSQSRAACTLPRCLQGHIIALPNVSLKSWQKVFTPLDPTQLADYVSVVIMCHARDRQHAEYLAAHVQCLKIKPRMIMHYVEHMISTYRPLYPHMEFDVVGSAMHAWDSMNDMEVPVAVRDNALCVETAYDAGAALNKYVGVMQGYANARPDVDLEVMAATDPTAMPSVEIDFASETHVLDYLPHTVVTQVLQCYPFVLQLPERLGPDGVNVLAPCETVITNVTDYLTRVHDLDSDPSLFYRQLDVHVKQVVRLHKLGENPMHRTPDGVEEVQVVVDTGGAFEASLPRAFQEFAAEHDVHMDVDEAGSEITGESDGVGAIDHEHEDVGENRSPDDLIADVLTGRAPDNAFIGVLAADAPPCPDFDRHFWIFTHPGAFPNGQGTYPEGMSFEWWAQRHLQRWPRPLTGQQPTLVLDMFNVRQRHAILRSAHTVMNSNPTLFRELAEMPEEEIKVALELFCMKRKGHTYAQRLADAPARVAKLLRAIRTINVGVECTPSWYSGLRSRLIAHWHATGPLTVFPTFNCSELYSPACLELLGCKVTYDQQSFGMPHDMPSVFERWRLVAANPVACAQYFDVFMHAVWEVLFGWPIGSPRQVNPNCLFGEVQSGCHKCRANLSHPVGI
eukprot:GHUV01014392.1.p1 GENE.GHUV01014392.1~~GHUV01014392.1.p1  ORF type:complete len:934 (+),score=171.54 GHUV01014392.1:683-3484(+)